MNIIFFGSSKFAVLALSRIISSSHKIICVVTQPDRSKGRGLALSATEVKKLSEAHKLKIYQPENVNSQESAGFLENLTPDLFVVVAFGQILSGPILGIPRIMAVNLHASMLPKYRGAAPVSWALIQGENQTGMSIIRMSQKLDAGPVILQRSLDIRDDDDAQTLREGLANLGADLLLEALDSIQANKYSLVMQDEARGVTLAPKLKKEDGLIHWGKPARDIFNRIRGCAGWPGASTQYRGKILKIHKASLFLPHPLPASLPKGRAGEILQISKNGILVATGQGNLLIQELQIEGKGRTFAQEFISGYRPCAGEILGEKN
ncbi:MAG: methionyl-tRNA formyltransferase [Candidatus Omnitrophota bacterium]